jgi:hypothetical protein
MKFKVTQSPAPDWQPYAASLFAWMQSNLSSILLEPSGKAALRPEVTQVLPTMIDVDITEPGSGKKRTLRLVASCHEKEEG